MTILKHHLTQDMDEFVNFKDHHTLHASCATIHYSSFLYRTFRFPEPLLEAEAIEFTRKYFLKENLRGFIKFSGFKIIWIDHHGTVRTSYYPPDYKITKSWLMVKPIVPMGGKVYLR